MFKFHKHASISILTSTYHDDDNIYGMSGSSIVSRNDLKIHADQEFIKDIKELLQWDRIQIIEIQQ